MKYPFISKSSPTAIQIKLKQMCSLQQSQTRINPQQFLLLLYSTLVNIHKLLVTNQYIQILIYTRYIFGFSILGLFSSHPTFYLHNQYVTCLISRRRATYRFLQQSIVTLPESGAHLLICPDPLCKWATCIDPHIDLP